MISSGDLLPAAQIRNCLRRSLSSESPCWWICLERVAESATTASKHHVLLIGPRGFGKTHLITLLNHRLSKDAAMSDRIRVAWLLEDETITSFVQLLKRIYEVLAQQYPVEFPLDWLQDLLTESPKRIREQLEAKLIEALPVAHCCCVSRIWTFCSAGWERAASTIGERSCRSILSRRLSRRRSGCLPT
jgi:energy-coupling factor transporter ATP-binding protein EcfA2